MESTNPTCKQLNELLDAFHDGELHGAEQAQVETHLKDCESCLGKLADINRVTTMLKNAGSIAAPAGFSARLDAVIDRQTKVVPMRRRATWAAGAVAAAAVLLVGVRFAGVGQNDNAPDTVASNNAAQQVTVANNVNAQPPAPVAAASHDATGVPEIASVSATATPHVTAHHAGSSASTTDGVTQIASVPSQGASLARTHYNAAGATSADRISAASSEEIADLPISTNSFNEAVGLSTDEDGLYDIKM